MQLAAKFASRVSLISAAFRVTRLAAAKVAIVSRRANSARFVVAMISSCYCASSWRSCLASTQASSSNQVALEQVSLCSRSAFRSSLFRRLRDLQDCLSRVACAQLCPISAHARPSKQVGPRFASLRRAKSVWLQSAFGSCSRVCRAINN